MKKTYTVVDAAGFDFRGTHFDEGATITAATAEETTQLDAAVAAGKLSA